MTTTEVHHEEWHGFDITYCQDDSKLPHIRYGCRVEKGGDLAFYLQGTVEDALDLHFKRPGVGERIQPLTLSRARAIIDLRCFEWGQTLERSLDEPRGADNTEMSDDEVRRKLLQVFDVIQHELPKSYTSKAVDVDGLCIELDISTKQYHSAVDYLLGKDWLRRWEHLQDSHNFSRLHITPTGMDKLQKDRRQARVGEPRSDQPDFSFVSDPSLRVIIQRDYAEIPTCVAGGAWKSATVMCGSVMEALLLDALLGLGPKAKESANAPKDKQGNVIEDLGRWGLNSMIEVATDFHMLRRDTLGVMSHTVREYRNLIHPGAEVRKAIAAEKEEAAAAKAVLDLIIKQLTYSHGGQSADRRAGARVG